MKLFVGIDIISEKLDVCFLTDDDQLSILSEISVSNDIEGASLIQEMILDYYKDYLFDQIVIGMVSTSIYSFHPSIIFHKDKELKKLNVLVTVKNPFRVKQLSRMLEEGKTDRNGELRITDFLSIQRFITSPIKEENYMALQSLTRTRYQLIKELTRTKQRFLENLTYKCNTLARERKNKSTNLFSATVISLTTDDFTLDELVKLPLDAFSDLIKKKGRGRFKQPEKIVKAIQRAIRSSYRLRSVAQESNEVVLGVLVCEIRALEKNIKELAISYRHSRISMLDQHSRPW